MDIVKGLAIILVIIGHSSINRDWGAVGQFIIHGIFSFHMPLFFIVSGYFISTTKPCLPYILSRNTKIMLALLAYSLIAILFYPPAQASVFSYAQHFILIWTQQCNYLWFFWALMISSSLVIILRPLKYASGLLLLVFALAAYYCKDLYPIPYCYVYTALFCAPFVYLGYLAKQLHLFQRKTHLFVFGLCLFILINASLRNKLDLSVIHIPYGIISLIASLAGSYVIIQVARFIELYQWGANFLAWSGKNVLLIIFVHALENLLIRPHYQAPSYIMLPLMIAICYTGTIAIILIKHIIVKLYKRLSPSI